LTTADKACLLAIRRGGEGQQRRIAMRKSLWVLTLCCAAWTFGALPAAAQEFPFCIKGCDFGDGRGDCSFSSYAQCQASAAGRTAWCDANPYYNARAELRPTHSRMSRRRF
jgi:Protein of unknown function (DUF3551)